MKKRALCAFDDKRYLLEDGMNSLAFRHKDIPARVTDIEDDAQDGVVMTREDAVRDYGRRLAVSDRGRDEKLQNPCPPPLSTITCSSTAPYMGTGPGSSSDGASTSTGGASTSTGGASTSRGGVWAERRWDRIQSNKYLIRAMLDFDDDNDEGEVRREFDGVEIGRAHV